MRKDKGPSIATGDFVEDTYTSFDGQVIAVTRGVVTEAFSQTPYVKYYCSQIVFGHDSLDGMLGTKVNRHKRNITVLSQRGGKVGQSG